MQKSKALDNNNARGDAEQFEFADKSVHVDFASEKQQLTFCKQTADFSVNNRLTLEQQQM